MPPARTFATEPADAVVRRRLDTGRPWVKLSGLDRLDGPADALVADLWRAAPDRLVLGTDWPHTPLHDGTDRPDPPVTPFRAIAVDRLIRTVAQATGGALAAVAVRYPARLCGLPAA